MRGVTLAVLLTVLAACGAQSGPEASGRVLYFAEGEELSGFNYNTTKDSGAAALDVAENVFFYAVKANPDYTLSFPGLEGPPRLVSENPQVVEWTIRPEAVWSDGTPVSSEDLRYYYEQAVEPDNDVASREGYEQISNLEVVDDKTVRAEFARPYADYTGLFAHVPQAAFMKAQPGGWDTGLDSYPGPSAGPFLLKKRWKRGESLILEANPTWWGAPKPGIDSIVLRFLTDSGAQVQALANREVDVITPPPDTDLVAQVGKLPGVRYEQNLGPAWVQATFNWSNPMLADQRVRQAIAQAIDRDAIVDAVAKPLFDSASRLDNFVYVTQQAGYQPNGAGYHGDLEAARRLLDGAGWTIGGGGIREKDGRRLSLRLSTASDGPLLPVQELVASQLKAAGVDIEFANCPFDCLQSQRLETGDFDLALFTWFGGVFPISETRGVYGTGSDLNYGTFTSSRFDELTERAMATLDPKAAVDLANQADRVLWEELPGLPLYQRPTFLAIRDRFSGVGINDAGDGVFWNSHVWRVENPQK